MVGGSLARLLPVVVAVGLLAAACGDNAGEDGGDDGTRHGAEMAETDCPGTTWQRVEASAFSFSVPSDFVDQQPQGVDSEVGQWSNNNGIDVFYDYGWYSGSIANTPGAVVEPVDYSGVTGTQTIVTGDPNQIQVFFDEVEVIDGQPNLLALGVNYADSADEIIGRCIVASIEWARG